MRTKLDELTPEERAELEAYKKKANKRADRKTQGKPSSRKVYSIVMLIAAILFAVTFVLMLVLSFALKEKLGIFALIALIGSISCIIAYLISRNITDKEFSEATTPDANLVVLHYDNEAVVCPHCGSTEILYHTKKFSTAKAVMGGMAFGYLGIACGIPNNKRIKCKCAKCSHKFEVIRK